MWPSDANGYWNATELARYVVRPNQGSTLVHASSLPLTFVEFQEIIVQKSGEFDQAAAKAGYLVPIPTTATWAYEVARSVTRNGAVADALRIVYTGPDQKYVDRFQVMFDNALKAIEQGDRPLQGAPPDPAADGRLFPAYAGIASPVLNATMGYPQDLGIPNDF